MEWPGREEQIEDAEGTKNNRKSGVVELGGWSRARTEHTGE